MPAARATGEQALAEEQRLLHVALSRATEHLTCSWTRQRTVNARVRERAPSPHLEAIDRCCRELAHDSKPAPPPDRETLLGPAAAPAHPTEADDDAALAGLRDWRRRHARALAVPEVAVLADDVLSEIARRRPLDVDELAAVQGVGPGRARRLGSALLAQLDSTRDEKPA